MISEALQKAREFEEQYGAFIGAEERPLFHLSPRIGWMNDPNGFSFYQGKFHMFYQYHPYATKWGPMHWGHAVSTDLLHWDYLPAALAPDQSYDKAGCFSGSAIEMEDGRQLLMYTGVREKRREDGTKQAFQTQCLAFGDGKDYVKYSKNPVLGEADIPEGFSRHDFRDPKLYRRKDGGYACVIGNRSDDGSGAILLYESEDAIHWRFHSILDRCYNEYGKMWECPDFFELEGRKILLVSPQDMCQAGLEFHNGNGTVCLIGSLDEQTGRLKVRRSIRVAPGGELEIGETKTEKGVRSILLPPSTLHILKERHKSAMTRWIFPCFRASSLSFCSTASSEFREISAYLTTRSHSDSAGMRNSSVVMEGSYSLIFFAWSMRDVAIARGWHSHSA